jgi:hypothetical protein
MRFISYIALFFLILTAGRAHASCGPGQSEVIISIVPDSWPAETTWDLKDANGVIIASGGFLGDTVCIPALSCAVFTIYDSFGDGILAPGGYWVYVDGALVANGNAFGYQAQHGLACPPGTICSSPITITPGNYTAQYDDTWYIFTPTQSGNYNLNTCNMNLCDTKIWVYPACTGILNSESPAGTYAFNDDSPCGIEANLDVVFTAGQTYYIRIGDNMNGCPGTVNFTLTYLGPVTGCTDPAACNYNPMATVDDGSCIYFPNPNCTGPDLKLDSAAFVSSMMLMTMMASACDVDEGCVTGYGTRYVITFTSKIDNIGSQDYYVGNPSSNPTMFNTVNCHGHAHFDGYGDYRLYDMNGNLMPAGHKNGFCVMDLCGFGQYNCGDMGISSGCYDVYGAGTQCQWVDITSVPDGDYRLAAIINQHHLPDALNHYELNHVNNALQVCINITRNAAGVPSYTILPNCTPFVDCMGIPGGAAMLDCNGVCGGAAIYGNVNGDLVLDSLDVIDYTDLLQSNLGGVSSCNDLNGDGQLTIYDAALAMWCFHTPHHTHPAGSNYNECNFPHNIVNPNDSAGLSISNVNFAGGYLDVEVNCSDFDIKAYQFSVRGVNATSVVSLASPVDFPADVRLVSGLNEVIAISQLDSALTRSTAPQPLCRIYFNAITDTVICIDAIREIINQDAERTIHYEYGNCFSTGTTALNDFPDGLPLALVPNPVSGTAWIQLPSDFVPELVEVFDIKGDAVRSDLQVTGGRYELDLSHLQSGMYLLHVVASGNSGAIRFVKQ